MSILIVCTQQAHTHAQSLLQRIAGSDAGSWEIDNKYYTARVPIRLEVLEELNPVDVGDSLAVIYAYTTSEDADPPETLTSAISSASPDLLFGIRLPSDEPFDQEAEEDRWDARGMEFVDLSEVTAEEGSERLDELRESLQTVLWPQMVRKPLASRTPHGESGSSDSIRADRRRDFVQEDKVDLAHEALVLDAWLDSDDVFPAPTRIRTSDGIGESFDDDFRPFQSAPRVSTAPSNGSNSPNHPDPQDEFDHSVLDEFEEQEDDDALLPTDPTPLLNHLTTIRDALATVGDPDERRRRAARELEAVFRGLGIGGLEGLDLEDLEELEG